MQMLEKPQISLKAARVNAGLTRREMADCIGVNQATIFNWERGTSEPNAS